MIAEPDKIAATREIHELKPRFKRNRQKKAPARKLRQPLEIALRPEEMLQHLRGKDKLEAAAVARPTEHILDKESATWMARARLRDRILAKIDAHIAVKRHAPIKQPVDEKAFAAAEIEDALRRQRAELGRERVMEPSERQTMDRICIGVFSPVARGGVVADGCRFDHSD